MLISPTFQSVEVPDPEYGPGEEGPAGGGRHRPAPQLDARQNHRQCRGHRAEQSVM